MIQVEKSFPIWILVKPSCCVFTVHVQTLEVCPVGIRVEKLSEEALRHLDLEGRVKATQGHATDLARAKRHEQKARCVFHAESHCPQFFSNFSFEKVWSAWQSDARIQAWVALFQETIAADAVAFCCHIWWCSSWSVAAGSAWLLLGGVVFRWSIASNRSRSFR